MMNSTRERTIVMTRYYMPPSPQDCYKRRTRMIIRIMMSNAVRLMYIVVPPSGVEPLSRCLGNDAPFRGRGWRGRTESNRS